MSLADLHIALLSHMELCWAHKALSKYLLNVYINPQEA